VEEGEVKVEGEDKDRVHGERERQDQDDLLDDNICIYVAICLFLFCFEEIKELYSCFYQNTPTFHIPYLSDYLCMMHNKNYRIRVIISSETLQKYGRIQGLGSRLMQKPKNSSPMCIRL